MGTILLLKIIIATTIDCNERGVEKRVPNSSDERLLFPFQPGQMSEYRVPTSCIRLTSDYNLFYLYCRAGYRFGYLWRVEKKKSERKRKWKFAVEIFTPFDDKMIKIWTFATDPSIEGVPRLAKQVAYSRHSINL